jgi:hypothetical protein
MIFDYAAWEAVGFPSAVVFIPHNDPACGMLNRRGIFCRWHRKIFDLRKRKRKEIAASHTPRET